MATQVVCDKPVRGAICGIAVTTPLTVTIGSVTYVLELCDDHQRPVTSLAEAVGRRNGRAPKANQNGQAPTRRRRRRKATDAEVRAWAADAGVDVSPTGRVPNSVKEAYAIAN